MHWLAQGLRKVQEEPGVIMETQSFKRNLFLNLYREGEKGGTVTDFIFLGSKITVDGDCSHEIKRCLLFGRKVMTNIDSILKTRDNHFANKCPLKLWVFQ